MIVKFCFKYTASTIAEFIVFFFLFFFCDVKTCVFSIHCTGIILYLVYYYYIYDYGIIR